MIGSAPSSVNLAPFKDASYDRYLGGKPPPQYPPSDFIDDTWQIWGCSPGAWAVVPRADRWFEVHRWEPGQTWFSPEYTGFLCQFRGPVYVGGDIPVIQNQTPYPIERVEAEFSAYFLHSSLSLMLALAILEIEETRVARRAIRAARHGAKPGDPVIASMPAGASLEETDANDSDDTIGLWGVDMAATEEYGDQRAGCQFFILEALRRGITVYVPPESCLLRPKPVYGLSEWTHDYIKSTARMRELNQRKQTAQATLAEASNQLTFLNGATDNLNYFINTWTSPYGIPAGVRVRQDPGTGLGGGMTLRRPGENVKEEAPPPLPPNPHEVEAAFITAEPPARAKARPKRKAAPKAKRQRKFRPS